MRVGWLLPLAVALTAGEVRAQRLHPFGGASLANTRLRSQGKNPFTGTGSTFLGEGALSIGRLQLTVSYLQGTLDPDGTLGASRPLVEGTVLLGVRALDWLTLETGPHARAYTLTAGTERWLFWELWRVVAADVNVPESFDHGQGCESGMIVRLARSPLEGPTDYRVEHGVLG